MRCCWCLPTIPISRLSAALILSRRTLHKRGARVWSPANCSYHTEIMPGYSAMVRAEHSGSGVLLYLLCVRCGDWWHCTPPSHGTRPRNMNWLRKHRGSRHQAAPAPYMHPCFWMELNKLQHSVQSNRIRDLSDNENINLKFCDGDGSGDGWRV